MQGTEAEACPRAVSATKQGSSGWVSTEKTLTANTEKAHFYGLAQS